jgi:hypothetical protein
MTMTVSSTLAKQAQVGYYFLLIDNGLSGISPCQLQASLKLSE